MTEKEIIGLALKLFAIYMLVQMILAIPNLIVVMAMAKEGMDSDLSAQWLWGVAAVVVMVGFATAVFLWKLAGKVLAKRSDEIKTNAFSGIEAAVLAALGLFLVVDTLVRMSLVTTSAYVQYVSTVPNEIPLQTIVQIVAYILQGLIGLSLILRTNGWVSLFRRLRYAGTSG